MMRSQVDIQTIILYAMSKKDKTIKNLGTNRYPKWVKV